MNWKKGMGFGVLLWIIMFVVVSIFIAFDAYEGQWISELLITIIGGVVAYVLAGFLKLKTTQDAFQTGLIFVVTSLILDAVITLRFNGQIFLTIWLWISYLLVLLAPAVRVRMAKH